MSDILAMAAFQYILGRIGQIAGYFRPTFSL